MSTPFSNSPTVSRPSWSTVTNPDGHFSPFPTIGSTTIDEVGYDEGGYGVGGYDAQTVVIQAASKPNWTVVSSK